MDKIEISDETRKKLAISIERLMGYLYAGILLLVIFTIENNAIVKSFTAATGGLLAMTICFSVGICIYSLYFRIVGELFLYPLIHFLHVGLDIFTLRWKGKKRTSTFGVLSLYGVKFLHCRSAYEFIKSRYLSKKEGFDVSISHGELHVLYLTSVMSGFAYLLIRLSGSAPSSIYIYVALLSYIAALISDEPRGKMLS